ncbi:methyltransferase [Marinomonas dokdonensis]|uniref:methyltransferase n=1 Tax=Marinomonas dokdonensis TaxID=328224 RepID=UPI00405554EF
MACFHKDFLALDACLSEHRALWQFDSFASLTNPWQTQYPQLSQYLDGLELADLEDQCGLNTLCEFLPSLSALQAWQGPQPISEVAAYTPPPSYLAAGIKGRKWQQIEAFVARTPKAQNYVEWCAGKGHLGKLLSYQTGQGVVSLEWQKTLCEDGQQQAAKLKLPQTFQHADVLKQQGVSALASTDCAVALHACGDLHRTLLTQAALAKVPNLCLSPCCYQLTKDDTYQPLSATVARHSQLSIRKADLKLAVKEVVTAGAREKRLKKQELTYRLGFDAWQRQARGIDEYLPLPSIQKALLAQGFAGFCQWAAECKGLSQYVNTLGFGQFEQVAEQRYQVVQKLEAISQLFRPALEHWLVLDRALYLQEQDYQVEIGGFCEKNITPRNWLIRASRAGQ